MFGWLTTLLSGLLFPLLLIWGRWPHQWGWLRNFLPRGVRDNHWHAEAAYIEMKARPWWSKKMRKWGVAGQTFLCFVLLEETFWARARGSAFWDAEADEQDRATAAFDKLQRHEAVHILQQSMFTPLLVLLVWAVDTLIFKAYQSYFPNGQWKYVAVWEVIAYRLDDDELDQ